MIFLNVLIMSFCGLAYQQLLAVVLSDATGDYVLSQALSLGLYLLGMGLGSWWGGKHPARWESLLAVEWGLALAGAFCVGYVLTAEMALRVFTLFTPWRMYLTAAPLILLLGFLNGRELPLVLQLNRRLKAGLVLAINYAGAFLAAATVPLFLLPLLDAGGTAHALGILNFAAATMLLPLTRPWHRLGHIFAGLAVFLSVQTGPALDRLHLQTVYFTPRFASVAELLSGWELLSKLGSPLRIRSKYQWIDIVPPEFSEEIQGQQDFQLYLDRKIQLSAGTSARYHESMVHGGANLLGRSPRRVLILGGGDGVLAHELLKYASVEFIDLVEIDGKMIELAKSQRDLVAMNGGALADSRVHIHIGDAIQFIRSRRAEYDLVLADLPFPASYDLALLYTKEFYAMTAETLSADGVLVLDFPLPGGPNDHLPDLLKTLNAAGFDRPFAFGAEDFFVAVAKGRSLQFDFEKLTPFVANQTLLNLVSRQEDVFSADLARGRVNSMLFPLKFAPQETWGEQRPAQILPHAGNHGLLPEFLRRFRDSWRGLVGSSFEMPAELMSYWRDNMNEPRNLVEEIVAGMPWPRFQWGIESRGDVVMPVYQWFDVKNPARLRKAWSKAYCMSDSSDWIGVNWTADKLVVEFFVRSAVADNPRTIDAGLLRGGSRIDAQPLTDDAAILRSGSAHPILVRRYVDGKFLREFPFDSHQWRKVGSVAPVPENPRAADIQFKLQREFLINPRTVASGPGWQRFYFP
jgi:spermidine synthase